MANSTGSGAAADAGTATESNVVEFDEAAAKKATYELLLGEAKAGVESAKAKIKRQQEHLEGAEQSLKNAEADLAALKEGK